MTGEPVTWRDVQRLSEAREQDKQLVDLAVKLAERHEVELHGERGVFAALNDLTNQLRWTQRALWAVAASIITAVVVQVLLAKP